MVLTAMISILTTVYNGSEFLEECARSVLLQECAWEWWIGINGHGEGGVALERAMAVATDPRIHVVNLPERGRVAALNALRAKATGEWIAILDCDDVWEPEKLVAQIAAIQMSPTPIDVIGTFCTYFGEFTGGPRLPSGWISREEVFRANPIINSSVLIRASAARWEDRYGLEDYDLWLRLAATGHTFFNIPHALVRHRIHGGSAFNGKGGQDLEALLTFHRSVTVVSAYYPIKSKYSVDEYMKWITDFWPRMQSHLIFYTEPGLVPLFEKVLKGKVVGIPFSSLAAFNRLSPLLWIDARRHDTEASHTPELYAMWYEKKEFVQRAISWNPFGSSTFVWCDAGIGRYPEWIPLIQGFPAPERVPRGKMLVLQIDPFTPEDSVARTDGIRGGGWDKRSTIGGGILASDIEGWNRWNKAYDAMFMRYYLAGRFIGKDQNIMASMILEDPGLAIQVKRPEGLGPIQGWFYLLFFLAGMHIS
jgi:glycosyltransferase involved in cell wall biosynthesis